MLVGVGDPLRKGAGVHGGRSGGGVSVAGSSWDRSTTTNARFAGQQPLRPPHGIPREWRVLVELDRGGQGKSPQEQEAWHMLWKHRGKSRERVGGDGRIEKI